MASPINLKANVPNITPVPTFNNPLSTLEGEYAISIKLSISEDDLKKSQTQNFQTEVCVLSSNIKYYIKINYNQENDEAFIDLVFLHVSCTIEVKLTSVVESADYKFSRSDRNLNSTIANCWRLAKLEHVFDADKKFFVDKMLTLLIDGTIKILGASQIGPTLQSTDACYVLWKDNESKDALIMVTEPSDSPEKAKKIQAHSCILRANSAVLKEMLTKSSNNEINIEGFSEETIATAVQYCYGVSVYIPPNLPLIIKLLHFADEFKIVGLKEKTEMILVDKVQESNVCKLFECSRKAHANMLNKKCHEFIVKCIKEGKQVADIDSLDNASKVKFFDDVLSHHEVSFRSILTPTKKGT